MEKKKAEEQENFDLVEKARENRKRIICISVAVIALVAACIIWYLVAQAGSRKADEAIGRADIEMTNDSLATSLYAEAANCGYRSGNRAKAMMGIRLYQEGKYAEAAEYLGDCSLDDEVAAAGVKILEGDCYVNLENYDKALSCYRKAIDKADENPMVVPFVLVKEANVYRAQQNYKEEAKALKTIIDEYPQYQAQGINLEALYQRAQTMADNAAAE